MASDQQHDDRFRRPTLAELMLLFPAVGFGLVVAKWYWIERGGGSPPGGIVLLSGLVFGLGCSAPVILSFHFLVRRRRSRLRWGEWVWLQPVLWTGAAVIASSSFGALAPLAALAILGGGLLLLGLYWLWLPWELLALCLDADHKPHWTEPVGFVSLLLSPLILLPMFFR